MDKTILIIEDEPAVRRVLKDTLQHNGFMTLEADTGQAGLELALAAHPDLILLDLLMPGMDGMTALNKIRHDAWGKTAPVIILTNVGATDERLVAAMVEQKPYYYLIKSDWKMDDIVKKIREVLNEPISSRRSTERTT